MAQKKGGGSTRNGRDSKPKMLGVKAYGGQLISAGSIIVRQRGTKFHPGVAVGLGPDAAAFAAITAVWPAKGNEFLAAKARAARAAVTGGDIDGGFVNEFHGGLPS